MKGTFLSGMRGFEAKTIASDSPGDEPDFPDDGMLRGHATLLEEQEMPALDHVAVGPSAR